MDRDSDHTLATIFKLFSYIPTCAYTYFTIYQIFPLLWYLFPFFKYWLWRQSNELGHIKHLLTLLQKKNRLHWVICRGKYGYLWSAVGNHKFILCSETQIIITIIAIIIIRIGTICRHARKRFNLVPLKWSFCFFNKWKCTYL